MATLHYAAGGGVDSQGNFAPAQAGFNLADVTYADQLNELPDGVQGLVWLNQYDGVTQEFIDAVTPFLNNPKVYGFYLVDEPDPTGQWGPQVSAADLKAESDWIHSHMPDAKTFVMLMNEGSAEDPHYSNAYTPENTHVDLFGIDWYPFWSDRTLDFSAIDKYVAAAQHIGISLDQIVPTYQTFGGGGWVTEDGSAHVMPTAEQEQALIDHWASLVPNPAFDYAYAWGSQNGDVALESSSALQQVFLQHNTSETPVPPVDNTNTPPVVDAGGSTPPDGHTDGSVPPVVDTGGSTPPVVDAGGSTAPDDNVGGGTPPVVDAGGSTAPDENAGGGTPPVDTAGGSTPPATDPTGSIDPVPIDHGFHGLPSFGFSRDHGGGGDGGFGHGLDFSQLLGAGRFSWVGQFTDRGGFAGGESSEGARFSWGGNHHASDTSIETSMDSSAVTDVAQSPALDVSRWAGGHNTDHHSWHW